MQSGEPLADDAGHTAGRSVVLAVLAGALIAWTAVLIAEPSLRASTSAPRIRQSTEAASVLAAGLTAAMAYVRFDLDRERVWLFVSLAFAAIAMTQFVFAIVLEPTDLGPTHGAYAWTSARLVAAVLLLLGARQRSAERHGSAARQYLARAAIVVVILVGIQATLWLLRTALPPLAHGALGAAVELRPGITALDILLGVLGTALFAAAAVAFRRSAIAQPTKTWLIAALILAAFSHIHYTLDPTIYTERVSTADFLRLSMCAVLLAGIVADVRRSFIAERTRAHELEDAYRRERTRVSALEQAERAKADILRMLTHELLHPVSSIRALALGLERGWTRLADTQKRAAVTALAGQSEQLLALGSRAPEINELRADMFTLTPERQEIGQLLGLIERIFSDPEVRVRVSAHPSTVGRAVSVDTPSIIQAFHNLLSNAAKYAPANTDVELTAEARDGEAVFRVHDHGPGVPSESQDRIFDRSFRVDRDLEGEIAGQGIGLYISRLIVESHGGRIWVEATNRSGATFAITLPLIEGAS